MVAVALRLLFGVLTVVTFIYWLASDVIAKAFIRFYTHAYVHILNNLGKGVSRLLWIMCYISFSYCKEVKLVYSIIGLLVKWME